MKRGFLCAGLALFGLAALSPTPAHASPLAETEDAEAGFDLPFAPPLDTPLDYRIDILHPGQNGDEMRFTRHFRLVFSRAEGGFVLASTLIDVDTEAPGVFAGRYQATMAPMLGRTVRFRLTADGRIAALDDPGAVRALFNRLVAEMGKRGEEEGSDHELAIAAVARYSALDDAELARTMFSDFRPILLFAGRRVDDQAIELLSHRNTMIDGEATGRTRLTLVDADGQSLRVEEQTLTRSQNNHGENFPEIVSTITYDIDRSTGLATRISGRDAVGGNDGKTMTRRLHSVTAVSYEGI